MAWRCQVWLYMPFTCEILAGRRSASPRACRCWLPAWLPDLSLARSTFDSPSGFSGTGCLPTLVTGRNLWTWLVDKPPVACGEGQEARRVRKASRCWRVMMRRRPTLI